MFKKYLLSNVYRDGENEGGTADAAAETARVAAAEAAAAGTNTPEARENTFQERIGELRRKQGEAERTATAATTRAEEAERRAAAAEALLETARAAKPGEAATTPATRAAPATGTSDEDIDALLSRPEVKKRIDAAAARRVEATSIAERGDQLYDKGAEVYTSDAWDKSLKTFQSFDGLREDVTRALLGISNGHDVLYHLGNHPTEIARIYKLAERDPIAMAVEIVKLGGTIKPPKKVSSATEPPDNSDTGRGGRAVKDYTDKEIPMKDFVEQREADLKKRGVRL